MDIRHPHFAEPVWLWLAVLAPLLTISLHRYAEIARRKQVTSFAAAHLLANLLASHSPMRRMLKNLLLTFAVAAVGIALARPQWGETNELSVALGEDIVFVMDCSRSMLVTDVIPSRLERAKFAVLDFVQKHGRGRVGLVAFSGEAFLQCPLTFDYDAFREALLALDDKAIPIPGTDIGRALDEASRAMEANDRHKVLVLLTDGEDLEKTGITTSKALEKKGVVIHCVGVGTPNGGIIHIINEHGMQDVLRDKDGAVVQSHLDETTLREIAQSAHGIYQPLGQLGEGLANIRQLVEVTPKSGEFAKSRRLGMDRFYFVVALITFVLAVEPLLGTRRRQAVLLLLMAVILSLSHRDALAQSDAPEKTSARELYNEGTKKLSEGKLADAESILQNALATQDQRIQPHALYNLGEARYLKGAADLKKKMEHGQNESSQIQSALEHTDSAITGADWALAGTDMDAIVSAYQKGRGTRKELKTATEAVRKAMETYASILNTWQRAAGDFNGAHELNPTDTDAQSNEELVDRQIARLVDMQRTMMMAMQGAGKMKDELGKKMAELKKRMGKQPGGQQKGPGDDDEDDDEEKGKKPKGPEDGQDEQLQKSGEEMHLTQEEAARLLGMLKLDANRKLFYGTNGLAKPKDRKGRDW
jgi:Ca-activated chloride channel family protein